MNEEIKKFAERINADWYECAPYGEQVPEDFARLLPPLIAKYSAITDADEFEYAIQLAEDGDPLWNLFECIFQCGATYAVEKLCNAVYDANGDILRMIDLRAEGSIVASDGGCKRITELEAENARLRELVAAYRKKRAVDGMNDRPWNASKHFDAEIQIETLETGFNHHFVGLSPISREALEDIAKQKILEEMTSNEYADADFETGYESLVMMAREAIAKHSGDANKMADGRSAQLEEALRLILPMAKGYAAEHPVGRNQEMVIDAEQALKGGSHE